MTTERSDGGPAFPTERISHYQSDGAGRADPVFEQVDGMTLRDWLAGQAPVDWEMARLAGGVPETVTPAHRPALWIAMAVLRYEYADAMITVRGQ